MAGKKSKQIDVSENLILPDKFRKSNVFIDARYGNWSLMANKLFNISLYKSVEKFDPETNAVRTIAEIQLSDIPNLNMSNSNIYKIAKETSDSLGTAFMMVEDREKGRYSHINIFSRTTYENGKFTLVFTEEVTQRGLIAPKSNYTNVFKGEYVWSNAAVWKLYEKLREQCFGNANNGVYTYEVGFNDLRTIMGLVDMDDPAFRTAEKRDGLHLSFDDTVDIIQEKDERERSKARKAAEDKAKKMGATKIPRVNYQAKAQYPNFGDFNKVILKPAVEEINRVQDIRVRYDTSARRGRGGKISKITFSMELLNGGGYSEEETNSMLRAMNDIFTLDVWSVNEREEILKTAEYRLDVIREKYELLLAQPENTVQHRLQWLLAAIREDYQRNGNPNVVDTEMKELAPEETEFDRIWRLYPVRSRTDLLSKRCKREAERIGYEKMKAAIERYTAPGGARTEDKSANGKLIAGGIFFHDKLYLHYMEALSRNRELSDIEIRV